MTLLKINRNSLIRTIPGETSLFLLLFTVGIILHLFLYFMAPVEVSSPSSLTWEEQVISEKSDFISEDKELKFQTTLGIGLLLLLKRRKVDMTKVGEMYGMLLKVAGILTLCGIASIFFGFLFGEFFGPSGVLHPILLFEIGPFKFGGFDPIHEPLTMLRFTIFLGVSFISGALFLGLINYIKRKEMAHAFSTICWMWFLIGSFYMWLHWGGISKITVWFGEGLPMLGALVIAPITLMFLILAKTDGIMAGFNHTIEAFIESLGHTLSFCRIAALFLTHAALNSIFLQLGNVENGHFTLKAIPFVLVGAVLSLGIEGLLVMVHVLRLHWIELLPKFYSGKGTPFKPIKIKQKTNITPDEKLWTQNL